MHFGALFSQCQGVGGYCVSPKPLGKLRKTLLLPLVDN